MACCDLYSTFLALEANKKCKAARDVVVAETKCRQGDVFELLLNTAQFELKLKEVRLFLVGIPNQLVRIFFWFSALQGDIGGESRELE